MAAPRLPRLVQEWLMDQENGPAGAAAYASWKADQDSGGNVDVALKSGVLAYAMGSGYADAASLPTGTAGEIARKAATTGAISGLSVAASGAKDEDILKAFVQSGGIVLVQAGQAYVDQAVSQNVDVTALQSKHPARTAVLWSFRFPDVIS